MGGGCVGGGWVGGGCVGGGCVFLGFGFDVGGSAVGGADVCVGVAATTPRVGVGDALLVGVAVGEAVDVTVGTNPTGVGLGEAVGVGGASTVLSVQKSMNSGSCPASTTI